MINKIKSLLKRKRQEKYKNYGKYYLYNFLDEHGYAVRMKKGIKYNGLGDMECLHGKILEGDKVAHLDMYHVNAIICVTIWVMEEVEGFAEKTEIEFSKYVNGELYEQRIDGRQIIPIKKKIKMTYEAIRALYTEAKEVTFEKLNDFFKKIKELEEQELSNTDMAVCEAAVKLTGIAAVAAASAMGKKWCLTGFQAGAVNIEFIRNWFTDVKTDIKIVNFDNMLYPQYEEKFDKTISAETWDCLQKEAKLMLESGCYLAPEVESHLNKIILGEVPFGYSVMD